MRYAINDKNEKIEVSFSGEVAVCEICKVNVKGRKGEQRIKHWYHHEAKRIDCDDWHEPISEWHLTWQNLFPAKNREVTIMKDGISHRADILLDNGLVIEVQNSPLKLMEVRKRERFYGRNNLIWILNGDTLAKNSMLKKDVLVFRFMLSISIPKSLGPVREYDFKELLEEIENDYEIERLKSGETLFELINENTLTFKFTDDQIKNFSLIQAQYKYYIACAYEKLYGQQMLERFRKQIVIEYGSMRETVIELNLVKKYWKKFIDEMEFPVFIDHLEGVEESELYYYSENKTISKEKFMDHYLKYT
ncbi:competence protein CoiA family protein [Muricauda sp. 334s03]|uniref:Competence protein CoiA family protein n=1 Tax=Flagellimonas yonaguniensis TaxID=3031325 RepID=A0ABT5Y0J5_9FLAO|nr:competence protein CoiA family protein [[Muricauda] yonaguniensis]MDF0716966.1 competence protein CoiA family protein [[Muricauda] yonaguniensis]